MNWNCHVPHSHCNSAITELPPSFRWSHVTEVNVQGSPIEHGWSPFINKSWFWGSHTWNKYIITLWSIASFPLARCSFIVSTFRSSYLPLCSSNKCAYFQPKRFCFLKKNQNIWWKMAKIFLCSKHINVWSQIWKLPGDILFGNHPWVSDVKEDLLLN